jgi:hypothetical protein
MVPPPPEADATLSVTAITIEAPMLGVIVMCPTYEPAARVNALADAVSVAGLPELTEKLPLVTAADSQVASLARPAILIALAPVVVRVMYCATAACPDVALNARLDGLATSVPPPPVPPGAYVTVMTVTDTGASIPGGVTGTSMIDAVQGLQLAFAIWKDKMSGVVKLFAVNVLNQKGTPETVYVNGVVPGAVTWIDRAWLSLRLTVVELTINRNCAPAGAAIASAVARMRAAFPGSL